MQVCFWSACAVMDSRCGEKVWAAGVFLERLCCRVNSQCSAGLSSHAPLSEVWMCLPETSVYYYNWAHTENALAYSNWAHMRTRAGSPGSLIWVNNFSARHKNGFGWRDCNPAFFFRSATMRTHTPLCMLAHACTTYHPNSAEGWSSRSTQDVSQCNAC